MNIDDLLRIAMERRASDLHLKVGNYPHLRIDGELFIGGTFGNVEPVRFPKQLADRSAIELTVGLGARGGEPEAVTRTIQAALEQAGPDRHVGHLGLALGERSHCMRDFEADIGNAARHACGGVESEAHRLHR